MKCLDSTINPLLHSLSGRASNRGSVLLFVLKGGMFPKQELILSSILLVTLKEWVVLEKKLNYTHSNVGVKVQPHQSSVLIVYPTQVLKYLRFV